MRSRFFLMVLAVGICGSVGQSSSSVFEMLNQNHWVNQNNQTVRIETSSGAKNFGFVLSFTKCRTLCPMMAHDLKAIIEKTSDLKVFIISVKPDEDTIESLKTYLSKRSLSEEKFEFIKNDLNKTKALTNALGLKFAERSLDGHLDHSTNLVVLDGMGKRKAVFDLTGGVNDQLLKDIQKRIN